MKLIKKLKILYHVNKLYQTIKKGVNMKKLLEREFILTIITIVANIWMAIAGFIPAELMIKIMAVVTLVYTVARAIVKFTPNKRDDKLLEDIEALFKSKK